ncbi:PD-(D/E)XK nuclease superfamily protein [Kordia periserrulae]|uniref:PD-(D/E)XK nuclease superfamily protein n=1 Tax=Kordia periserrulae TaxID=701523 RepID=A0A2T6C473_9FLAO|nr:PD-(D/E)XK nuclease family protein [Kordia periserrulae]PTX63083.1 PD-(D/E)XK nuclease superfamily protein [Kordia periserrulae]
MNQPKASEVALQVLQTFLNTNEIPTVKGKPKTFLSIAKQPHYENVWSNIYAFYFNVRESHKLNNLFIKSLISLIRESSLPDSKTIFETFLNFDVVTELGAKEQKRMDIALFNNDQAILIENKVYHMLNNDLDIYYNELDKIEKVGIVLSLEPISKDKIEHPRFINITHLQLMQRVMQYLGTYLLKANDKYVVFLKDFYQNIINLSQPYMEQENINFYYQHQQKINQLVHYKFKLREHILSEVVKVGNELENLEKYEPRLNSFNDKRLVYYVCPHERNLMITVVYEKLLTNERVMHIAVEMQGDLLQNRNIYKEKIQFADEEKAIFANHFETTQEGWAHFAIKHYSPTPQQIGKLAEYIHKIIIDDHLLAIYNKLAAFF